MYFIATSSSSITYYYYFNPKYLILIRIKQNKTIKSKQVFIASKSFKHTKINIPVVLAVIKCYKVTLITTKKRKFF